MCCMKCEDSDKKREGERKRILIFKVVILIAFLYFFQKIVEVISFIKEHCCLSIHTSTQNDINSSVEIVLFHIDI